MIVIGAPQKAPQGLGGKGLLTVKQAALKKRFAEAGGADPSCPFPRDSATGAQIHAPVHAQTPHRTCPSPSDPRPRISRSRPQTADGLKDVKLSDNFGKKKTLLLFFPLAFTGTCTQEMCDVTAGLGDYAGLNARGLRHQRRQPLRPGGLGQAEQDHGHAPERPRTRRWRPPTASSSRAWRASATRARAPRSSSARTASSNTPSRPRPRRTCPISRRSRPRSRNDPRSSHDEPDRATPFETLQTFQANGAAAPVPLASRARQGGARCLAAARSRSGSCSSRSCATATASA